jgi:hypothetical protein
VLLLTMARGTTLLLFATILSGCVGVPPENPIVRDEASAIEIGMKVCDAKGILNPKGSRKWTAQYSHGIWIVELPYGPPGIPGWVVEVNAVTGESGSCELNVPLEQVVSLDIPSLNRAIVSPMPIPHCSGDCRWSSQANLPCNPIQASPKSSRCDSCSF